MRIDPTPLSPSQPVPAPVRAVAAFALPPLLQLAEPLPAPAASPAPMPPPAAMPGPMPQPTPTAWAAPPLLADRVSLTRMTPPPSAVPPERQLQAILQRLAGDLPLPAGLQLALRPSASPYLPATPGPPAGAPAAASAPAALLQAPLVLELAPGQGLPARMTLALMPALVAAQPELAEALKLRLSGDLPLPVRLDAPPAELAGQRLLFELVDPRAQWAAQTLAMRGLLVVERQRALPAKPGRLAADDEDEGESTATAAPAAAYTLPEDDGPPRISTLRWASLWLYPLFARLRALLR